MEWKRVFLMEKQHETTIGRTFGARVQAVRTRRRWSQRELADRLTRAGRSMNGATVAKIEAAGKPDATESERTRAEGVTVRDLLVFSAVLGVSPLHMLVPLDGSGTERDEPDPGTALVVTDQIRLYPVQARGWIKGTTPILSGPWINESEDDELWRVYYSEVPTAELAGGQARRSSWERNGDVIEEMEREAGRGLEDDEIAKAKKITVANVQRLRRISAADFYTKDGNQ